MQIYEPGTLIGQYEIASNPMIGGMGVVYFCLDQANNDHPVALKTFKPEFLPDRAARDRFLREGTAWIELGRHPNIVRCYKVEYIDPTAFLSLELIAKEQGREDASLRSWMGAPMPVEQALLFALQIARGMQHAVEKIPGFVHRDLKPENLLVGADKLPGTEVNRLRVTDFGMVAILQDETGRLKDEENLEAVGRTHLTHGIVGTPLYMAPEQWKGEPLGTYTDIYTLGSILFEMLSGHRAASGSKISELKAAHCSGSLCPLSVEWPLEVRELLTTTLDMRQQARPQSWSEITRALEQAYAAQGMGSAPQLEALQVENLEDRKQAGWSYNAMGIAYLDMGKAEVAAGYFQKALALARETGNCSGEGSALGNLGSASAALGDSRRAIQFWEQYLAIALEIGERRGEGAALGSLGVAYLNLGDPRRSIQFHEQALAIARDIGDRRGEGNALGNLGSAFADLGEPHRAIQFYEQRLTIAHEIGDRRSEGNALGNLGIAYKNLGNPRRAISFHEQALVIDREIGDRRGEGADLGNLGTAYSNLGDHRRAISFHEQRLVIAREIGDRRGEGNALGNLGNYYADLGENRCAISFYEQQIVITCAIGDRHGEALGSWNLGLAYEKAGEIDKAISAMEVCVTFERAINHPDAEKDAAKVNHLRAQLQGGAPAPAPQGNPS